MSVIQFPDKTPNAVQSLKRYAEKIKSKDFAIRDRDWQNEQVCSHKDITLAEKHAAICAQERYEQALVHTLAQMYDKLQDKPVEYQVIYNWLAKGLINAQLKDRT